MSGKMSKQSSVLDLIDIALLGLRDTDKLASSVSPVTVYLSSLSPGSRRTMHQSLNAIALLLTGGKCDAETCPWHLLRYQEISALRATLIESYAPATCNKMLAAVKGVLKECERLGQMSAEACSKACSIKRVKGVRLLKGRALSGAELEAIAIACRNDTSIRGVRDLALVTVLRVGLRRSELVNLDIGDFAPDASIIRIRSGKGDKDREVFISSHGLPQTVAWLGIRGDTPGALFLPISKMGNITHRRLSPQSVATIIQRRGQEAGLANFTPHDFRRTFISDLFDQEVDVSTIQKLVGHSDPATTTKYDRRGDEAKRRAVEKLQ